MKPGMIDSRERFLNGELTKHQYNAELFAQHRHLFEYVEFLKGTGIGRIEITDTGVILTSREGGRFHCDPDDQHQTVLTALNFGAYEAADAALLYRMVCADSAVYDIGANMGWYTIHVAQRMPAGRVVAFEPIPHTFDYLSRNVKLNELSNVTLFNIGLSSSERGAQFFYSPSCSGGTSEADILGLADTHEVKCSVRRLDDVRRELGLKADLIKCDVEGAELFVFQGGTVCIGEDQPIIYCEMLRKWSAKFGYGPNDIIALLGELGYQCFEAAGERLRLFPRMEETTVATNFFFLHSRKHADVCRALVS